MIDTAKKPSGWDEGNAQDSLNGSDTRYGNGIIDVKEAADAIIREESVEISLGNVTAKAGEEVKVPLTASNGSLAGYEVNVSFDPDVATVVGTEGVDLDDPVNNTNNQRGWLSLTQSSASEVSDPHLSNILFEIEDSPDNNSTALRFVDDSVVLNDQNETIRNITSPGSIDVIESSPVSIKSLRSNSPIKKPKSEGEVVNVTSEIKNPRSYEVTDNITLTIDGNLTSATSITLSQGESRNVTLGWQTELGDGAERYNATVSSTNDSASVTVGVEMQPIGDSSSSPQDLNDDGLYRDVNGNGDFNIVDVAAFYYNRDDIVVKNHPNEFDYNGNGDVNIVDVATLYDNR